MLPALSLLHRLATSFFSGIPSLRLPQLHFLKLSRYIWLPSLLSTDPHLHIQRPIVCYAKQRPPIPDPHSSMSFSGQRKNISFLTMLDCVIQLRTQKWLQSLLILISPPPPYQIVYQSSLSASPTPGQAHPINKFKGLEVVRDECRVHSSCGFLLVLTFSISHPLILTSLGIWQSLVGSHKYYCCGHSCILLLVNVWLPFNQEQTWGWACLVIGWACVQI